MDFKNIDRLIGAIIANKQATLNELKTVYSLEDAYLIWEAIAVTRYNEYLAAKHAASERKGK